MLNHVCKRSPRGLLPNVPSSVLMGSIDTEFAIRNLQYLLNSQQTAPWFPCIVPLSRQSSCFTGTSVALLILTHWGLKNFWMKMIALRSKFCSNVFLRVHVMISQHWFNGLLWTSSDGPALKCHLVMRSQCVSCWNRICHVLGTESSQQISLVILNAVVWK